MMMKLIAAGVAVGLFWAGVSHAQPWPSKPVRLIVGFPAGGGVDFFARALGQKLQEQLGQPVIVDNRSGANGIIGADVVAKAPPDGYTVLISNEAQIVINQNFYSKMPYDPVKDLEPVSEAVYAAVMMFVHPSVPVKSLKELIALAKAKPGQLAYASVGTGTVHHLTAELLKSTAKINILHVPYKGGGPASIAMVSGEVPMGFAGFSALAHARSGRLRALATTGSKRGEATPDLPTFVELGFPDIRLVGWYGVLVPARTPNDIISRLYSEVLKAVHAPDLKTRLAQQGIETVGTSPDEFARFIQSEIPLYAKLVKESGAKLD